MKVVTIVGARPQFIKAAVVSRAFREHRPEVTEILVHTGQHFDANMSDVFFEELAIPRPAYHLSIGSGTHGQNTGRMIKAIEGITGDQVRQVGDVMYDTALCTTARARRTTPPDSRHAGAGGEELHRICGDGKTGHAIADLL